MDSRKIRVAFTYIAYPVAMGRYLLEALARRDDIELWVAAPFSDTAIPWKGGMILPKKYVRVPDLPLGMGSPPEIVYKWVEKHVPWEPDLWLEANAGLRALGRPTHGQYFVVGTDPHVINYSQPREIADKFFCMQKPYMQPGDIWLPYAYDPIWHSRTTTPWDARIYDVALIGLPYPNRRALMGQLAATGKRVILENGPAYHDAREIYHVARIGLNWSSMLDTTARVFEIMAFGITPVLNRVPDLAELFDEGRDFIGFGTIEEGKQKIEAALADKDMSLEIARNARKAVEPHTWDARIQQILEEAGLV